MHEENRRDENERKRFASEREDTLRVDEATRRDEINRREQLTRREREERWPVG